MRHRLTLIVILACFGAMFLTCYAPVLFRDHQFAYRDAGKYYYWLNKRVQDAWDQGRWPLWEPEENAGMPLLGNPTAAVLYPGKLLFAVLPYAWAARAYILAHSALAFLGMLVLMRSWGTSGIGSAMSAMAYAFGGPVLFQYSNVIYLIGAAWLPLGLHAVDRWVRRGRSWGLVELAIVLALQVLGGEPQAAYLLGVASLGYAAGLTWSRRRSQETDPPDTGPGRPATRTALTLAIIALAVWCLSSLAAARWLPTLRGGDPSPQPFRWTPWVPAGVLMAWGVVAIALLLPWRRQAWRRSLSMMWIGLAGAAALAAALTAAQLLPVLEFTQRTGRVQGTGDEGSEFTVPPVRLLELAWPNVLGTPFESNDYWGDLIRMPGRRPRTWVPTLYLGGMTLALAVTAFTIRCGPAWRIWLTGIGVLGLLASLGQCTSPIWAARVLAATWAPATVRDWLPEIGPLDPADPNAVRRDGYVSDADGGVYWGLATVLPGFRHFRYPAKLFTLTAMAIAGLAGFGWDRLVAGRGRRTAAVFLALWVLTVATLAVVAAGKGPILASFREAKALSTFGPLDAVAAHRAIMYSLGQAAIVFGVGLVLTLVAAKHPVPAGVSALVLMTADLAAANARYVLTVPQSLFEARPEAAQWIEDAERADRSHEPFRIHRVRGWSPRSWGERRAPDRFLEQTRWEHDTLDPKHGIGDGLQYTYSLGVGELADYEPFFASSYLRVPDDQAAAALGVAVGDPVIYFPRRAYDLWNTRYFIVPFDSGNWLDLSRNAAPFLFQTRQVFPNPAGFEGPQGAERAQRWTETRDVRVLRNLAEYPRAWVVHDARATSTATEPRHGRYSKAMKEILYAPDPVWHDALQPVYDPRSVAWMSRSDRAAVRAYLSGRKTAESEAVAVSYRSAEQAVLDVELESPGLVVLADVDYPGWGLAIDGKQAPIYRVNGLMRGAAVSAGRHRLVYTYAPRSFQIGMVVSLVGVATLLLLAMASARWPSVGAVGGGKETDDRRN